MRLLVTTGLVVALLAGACSGELTITTSETDAAATPADVGSAPSGVIGPLGGVAEVGDGVLIEAVEGAFTTSPTFETVSTVGVVPAGMTAVGAAVEVTASEEPAMPVIVGLPIPAGEDPEGLVMLYTHDGGEPRLLGGFVEDGRYLAAAPGFSTFQLVRNDLIGQIQRWDPLGSDIPRVFATAGLNSMIERHLAGEYTALVSGELDTPAHRSAMVVGPGEVAVGQSTVFTATGFISYMPQLADYVWGIHGGGLVIEGTNGPSSVWVNGTAVGRVILSVEITDPFTGATAYASTRVFVVEDTLTITAVPDRSFYFEQQHRTVLVTATARGGTPPYKWTWSWSDGGFGDASAAQVVMEHGPIQSDLNLTLTVKDSIGIEANAVVAVRGLPGREPTNPYLVGPVEGQVGQELVFEVLSATIGAHSVIQTAEISGVTGTVTSNQWQVTAVFNEPGIAAVAAEFDIDGESYTAGTAVRIEGEPAPSENVSETTAESAPAESPPGVGTFNGTYLADQLIRDPGAIIEILDTDVVIDVLGGNVQGHVVQTAIVESSTVYESGGEQIKTEKATQTMTFTGTIDDWGRFDGSGLTRVVYVLLSCRGEPETQCLGATATQTSRPEGVQFAASGSIVDGVFAIETINSVSSARATIEARLES